MENRPANPYLDTSVQRIATVLYDGIPGTLLQKLRAYVCPYQALAAAVPEGGRVLDVGCGSGLFLGLLAHQGRISHGVGFDAGRMPIERAKRMRERLSTPALLEFERRDLLQAWPEGLFDVVSIIDVMHHLPPKHQSLIINRAATRLAPGGIILYKDMAARPLWRASMNRLHDLVVARQWIHYVTIDTIATWAAAAGLVEQKREHFDMLWYRHEMLLLKGSAASG